MTSRKLTEKEFEHIINEAAKRAAPKAKQLLEASIAQAIGKSVIRKLGWALGLAILAFLAWAGSKGWIK